MIFLDIQSSLQIAKHFHLCFAILPSSQVILEPRKLFLSYYLPKVTQLVYGKVKTNLSPLTLSQAFLLHGSSHPPGLHKEPQSSGSGLCLAGTKSFEGQSWVQDD